MAVQRLLDDFLDAVAFCCGGAGLIGLAACLAAGGGACVRDAIALLALCVLALAARAWRKR